jgi:hypothetical protein
MEDLNASIESLGRTAMAIADERNSLLKSLREVINAADIHGTASSQYAGARFRATTLLQKMLPLAQGERPLAAAGKDKDSK